MSRGDHQVTTPEALASLIKETLAYLGNVAQESAARPGTLQVYTSDGAFVATVAVSPDKII
jgi:hypothetical protein